MSTRKSGLLIHVPCPLPSTDVQQVLEAQVELYLTVMADDDATAREYKTAKQMAPQLVRTESQTADFLRCENMNPMAAALRITRYWKARKQ